MPSPHHKPNWLGRPAQEMDANFQHLADQKPARAACLFCDWTAEGTVGETRKAARDHRAREHPHARWTQGRNRRTTKRPTLRTDMHHDDWTAVEAERQRRARLHGIEEELV
jgi:hypothetical protein